jgi:hypothetical protein
MSGVKMVIIPLVMAVIFSGVAKLGDPRKLGRLGGLSVGFMWVTVIPAILLGMAVSWLGIQFTPDLVTPLATYQEAPELPGLVDFVLGLIPDNPFAAASSGQLLPLIVFTALFGAAAGTLREEARRTLLDFSDAVSDALIKLVWWILWTAPIGVLGLVAPVTAQLGWAVTGATRPKTPIGAVQRIHQTSLINASLTASEKSKRVLRASSRNVPAAAPNNAVNTIKGRSCPLLAAANGLSGINPSTKSTSPGNSGASW